MRHVQSAAERAYAEIKQRAITGGMGPGRIDLQRLADALRMSQTPVREALARLAAERLVEASPGYGYAVVIPSARQLRQLYAWSGELAELALANASATLSQETATLTPTAANDAVAPEMYAMRLTTLLCDIAANQENNELAIQARQAGERLYQARLLEPSVFAGAVAELHTLAWAWRTGQRSTLLGEIRRHHKIRADAAPALAEALAARAYKTESAWP